MSEAESAQRIDDSGDEAWTAETMVAYAHILRGPEFPPQMEHERNEHAHVLGGPLFVLRHVCPDLWAGTRPLRVICGGREAERYAIAGGRWLNTYAKAVHMPAHLKLEIWTERPAPKVSVARPILAHLPLKHVRKKWQRTLDQGLPPPDLLLIYAATAHDAVDQLLQVAEWPPSTRIVVSVVSTMQAMLTRVLLQQYGFSVGSMHRFFEDAHRQPLVAVGHVSFEITRIGDAPSAPSAEALREWQLAQVTYASYVERGVLPIDEVDSHYGHSEARDGAEVLLLDAWTGVRVEDGRISTSRRVIRTKAADIRVPLAAFDADLRHRVPNPDDFADSDHGVSRDELLRYARMCWLSDWMGLYVGQSDNELAAETGQGAEDVGAATAQQCEPTPHQSEDPPGEQSIEVASEPVEQLPPRSPRPWQLPRRAGTTDVLAMAGILGAPGEAVSLADASRRVGDWLARKGYAGVTAEASSQTSTPDGEVTIETDGRTVWALRFDDRRGMEKGAIWRVELTLLAFETRCAIGLRLYQLRGSNGAPAPTSGVPTVVAEIGREFGLWDAATSMRGVARAISTDQDVSWLTEHMHDPRRVGALVVISGKASESTDPAADRLAARLFGLAHVVVVDESVARNLSAALPPSYGVYGNAVRVYRPRPGVEDVPKDHPLWALQGRSLPSDVANNVAEAVSAVSLEHDDLDDRVPPFRQVRRELSESRLLGLQNHTLSLAASVDEERSRHQAVVAHLERERSDQESLIRELSEQVRGLREEGAALRRERDEALDDVRALRRNESARWLMQAPERAGAGKVEPKAADELPTSWDDLEDWTARNCGDRLVLLPSAAKAARASAFEDVAFAYQALGLLGNEYVAMRARGADDDHLRIEFDAALAELGVECSPVGAAVDRRKFKQDYRRRFEGREIKLDMHLKRGAGYDPATLFRIYFNYCDETGRVIVGHMPGHLTNHLTRNA